MQAKILRDHKQSFNKRSFLFSLKIIELVDNLPQQRSCWVMADQLVKSGTSIGANIIEAQAASSKKDYINFYNHALKSANETKYWLALLKESKKAPEEKINLLLNEVDELSRILAASILTMKKKRTF